jgi:hypothetical protein
MTDTAGQKVETFTLASFTRLFRSSPASKFLTRFEMEQIKEAVEEKNLPLLQKLYMVLLEEKKTDEEVVRNFVMSKNRIMDDFSVKTTVIEKKYIEGPKRKKRAKAEAADKADVEDILNQI